MEAKMKRLLKGLRYISQIFDGAEEKEPEMQIGFPTDVKHVAHIGCDGQSANNSPGWMNEFRQAQPTTDGERGGGDPQAKQRNSSDPNPQGVVDSPDREGSSNRPSRRNQSSGTASAANSRSREAPEGGKQGRTNRSAAGEDPSGSDLPAAWPAPKQTRRKAKGSSSSGGASTKSSSGTKGGDRLASGSGAEDSGHPD